MEIFILDLTCQQSIKIRNNQEALHQTRQHPQEKIKNKLTAWQKKKKRYGNGKNIFKPDIWKGVNIQTIKGTHTT